MKNLLLLNGVKKGRITFTDQQAKAPLAILENHLKEIKRLLETEANNSHPLHTMLHAQTISVLEAYLSSTLIKLIINNINYQRKFVSYMNNNDNMFSLKKIVNEQLTADKILIDYLGNKSFHNVRFLKKTLNDVFNIQIEEECQDWLNHAVNIRHDCVHRAGYDKDNKPVELNKSSIKLLINNIESLVHKLEKELPVEL